ncbi:MAG TPA: DUF4175 family protein [Chthoniobacteraceae bacterium]|nr:DUF4175 family protein [Chthoniobacteraceae bacterium]
MKTDAAYFEKGALFQLRLRVAATRARLLAAQAGTGAVTAASLLIGVFAAEMTLDWLTHLPWLARACFSLPALGGAGWIVYREIILPLMRLPSEHAVACAIERAMPDFKTRLIASIQLGRSGQKGNALVGALIRETASMAKGMDFRKAVKMGKLLRALRVLVCVLVVAGGLGWLGRANVKLLLERALLLTTRLPSRTQIVKIESPAKIAAGEDLNIGVQGGGVLPESGTILAQDGAHPSEYKLEKTGASRYQAVIKSVPASLSFTVRLGDAASDPVAVTVLSPPAVLGVQAVQDFPAYTKLPPMTRHTGDLSLLAGSILKLTVTATSPIKSGSIHLAGLEKDLPMSVNPANPRETRGEIAIPREGLTGFSLKLVDTNDIPSRETAVYAIDIVPDRPPVIKITHPGQEDVATAQATEVIAFRAEDDFGLAAVFLHYTVNSSAEKVIEFDLGGANPRQIERRFEWKLSTLKLSPGGVIDYWMEAEDANNVTGPGRGETDKARIKIVTDDEKRLELTGRMNDALGSLDEVSQSEDNLSKRLGTQIFQKPESKPEATPP